MKYRYSKFTGDPLDEIDIEDLVSKLSDLLLSSGFDDPWSVYDEERHETLQSLYDAIMDALLNGGMLSDETIRQLLGDDPTPESWSSIERLVQQLIDRLADSGYITLPPDAEAAREAREDGAANGPGMDNVRFEVTDKGLDFLGYRALRDLMGALGKSNAGRHDSRDVASGIEAGAAPKPYEFGDTLNLDASATVLNAVSRGAVDVARLAAGGPLIDVGHDDLMVAQGEYQSSCATVLMLDCSHSMILYGEDRFTPAKRVALALANMIRHQFPGDALNLVLFHDSAEEVPIQQLARVRVGPHYTNTREGLRLARRILERQRKDMRQIVMITDGKPSALTTPDGRIYRNAFGLDPMVVHETIAEVAACRKAGIMINTFMLARDPDLVAFVRQVAHICRGKAYFTTPRTLGQYVLLDYMNNKTRTVH